MSTREFGIFQSIQHLIACALQFEVEPQHFCQQSEAIALKLLSSPLNYHTQPLCEIIITLLNCTSREYHLALTKEFFNLSEAIYKELKKGSQEAFKKKVLFKLNYCIGIICL